MERDRELMRVGYSTLRVTRLQAETETVAIVDTILVRLRAAGPPNDDGGP